MDYEEVLEFANLLNTFRKVERSVLVNGEDRLENDVEHSYQLTMLAWFILSSKFYDLDTTLVIKYALVHDLVEVYAGDTFLYSKDKEYVMNKKVREKEAYEKIKKEFKKFKELHRIIEDYEERKDRESKFVHALDKIQPMLNIYLDKGRSWQKHNITLAMILETKKAALHESAEIGKIFAPFLKKIEEEEEQLFTSDAQAKKNFLQRFIEKIR